MFWGVFVIVEIEECRRNCRSSMNLDPASRTYGKRGKEKLCIRTMYGKVLHRCLAVHRLGILKNKALYMNSCGILFGLNKN